MQPCLPQWPQCRQETCQREEETCSFCCTLDVYIWEQLKTICQMFVFFFLTGRNQLWQRPSWAEAQRCSPATSNLSPTPDNKGRSDGIFTSSLCLFDEAEHNRCKISEPRPGFTLLQKHRKPQVFVLFVCVWMNRLEPLSLPLGPLSHLSKVCGGLCGFQAAVPLSATCTLVLNLRFVCVSVHVWTVISPVQNSSLVHFKKQPH